MRYSITGKIYIPDIDFLKYFISKKSTFKNNSKSILFIFPWTIMGGADKFNIDILEAIKTEPLNIHIITTEYSDNAWHDKFSPYTKNFFHLYNVCEPSLHLQFINEYIKANKIDTVFLSNSRKGYEVLPMIKKENADINIIDLLHGEGGEKDNGGFPKISTAYDKFINKRIVSNEYLKNILIKKYHINGKRIEVICNGIDTEQWKREQTNLSIFRNTFDIKKTDFLVSFMGRLSYEKHPEKVVRICDLVVNKFGRKNIKFIIAGNGELYDDLKKQIIKKNLQKYIYLTGVIDNPSQLISESNILVLVSEVEGIPMVVLEAMSMNVPVISSNVGGVSEIISDNEDGFLFPYNENLEINMAKNIIELEKDGQPNGETQSETHNKAHGSIFGKISGNARKKMLEKFDMEIFKEKYITLLM
jgi:glycosyltransferase involved in cell wall biosynthesis